MNARRTLTVTRPPEPNEGAVVHPPSRKRSLQHPLSEAELTQFQEQGYLILRGVFSADEIRVFREESEALTTRIVDLSQEYGRDPAYNLRFEIDENGRAWKIDPFVGASPVLATLTRDRRICDRLASFYDGHEPVLFKDKLIRKPANSHGNGLHQDYNWWQGFPESLISVSVALDKTTRENGCTEFWSGWQRGFLHEPGQLNGLDPAKVEGETHIYGELEAGDIVLFHCLTPHAAGPNESDSPRRVLFLTYNDSRDGEHYAAHYEHFHWYRAERLSNEEREKRYFF